MRIDKVVVTDRIADAIFEHAAQEYPRECCGVVVVKRGRAEYVPCRNVGEIADGFVIHPEDYASAEESGVVVAVAHSHPDVLPKPSDADLVGCEASGLPWIIVSYPVKLVELIEPSGYVQPLLGRKFVHGIFDCYSLIRDYYKQERGIELMDFERRNEWWLHGDNLYMENFKRAGFEELRHDQQIEEGDGILMQLGSPVINHAAIYIGDNKIIHHLFGRLSSRDVYGGYWQKATVKVVRYVGQKDA